MRHGQKNIKYFILSNYTHFISISNPFAEDRIVLANAYSNRFQQFFLSPYQYILCVLKHKTMFCYIFVKTLGGGGKIKTNKMRIL
jgi:hypothetical protein